MKNKEKNIPKGPVKFQLQLSQEQKEAKALLLPAAVGILTGVAGTSKTFLACQIALDRFFRREVNRISFSRPAISTEDMGHLPGTIEEKYMPWCLPLIDNMYKLCDKEKIDKMMQCGDILFRPLQFIRGITFDDEIAILDEAQNATKDQILMFLTRLGKDAKILITGDSTQVDLKTKASSGLASLVKIAPFIDEIQHIELVENYRSPLVAKIIKLYGD